MKISLGRKSKTAVWFFLIFLIVGSSLTSCVVLWPGAYRHDDRYWNDHNHFDRDHRSHDQDSR